MSKWTWDIIDLCIVLFESVFLYYWFFSETFKYRISDRRKRVVLMMIFPCATYILDFVINVPSGKMFILLFVGSVLVYFIYQCTIMQAVVRNILFMTLLVCSESIAMGLLLVLHGHDNISLFLEHSFLRLQCVILSKLINVVLVIVIIKIMDKGKNRKYTIKEGVLLFMQAFSSILCLIMIVEFTYYQHESYSWSMSFLAFLGFVVLISYIISYYFMNGFFIYKDREKEILLIEMKNSRLLGDYENLRKSQKKVYELYHDIKKHINFVNMMENNSDVNEYLEECMEGIKEIEGEFQSGNQYLDMILYDEWKKASEMGIKVQFAVQRDSLKDIALQDVVIILGNALENAREACKKRIEAGKTGNMQLKIILVGDEVIFVISNNYVGEIKRKGGVLQTTKGKTGLHGIGIKSIKSSVDKYNGSMNYMTKEDKFVLTIALKIISG